MADDPASYIAWDGKRYVGEPPTGWFLAADNRWWPNNEITEQRDQPQTEPASTSAEPTNSTTTSASTDTKRSRRTGPRPTVRMPKGKRLDTAAALPPPLKRPPGLAPMAASTPLAPPGPGQTRKAVGTKRQRGKVPALLLVLGFWIASVAGSEIFGPDADEPTIVYPTETTLALPDDIEILTPAAPPTSQPSPVIATFSDNNVNFDLLSCGPDTIVGVVSTTLFDIDEVRMVFAAFAENTPQTVVPAPSLDAQDLDLRAGHTVAIDLPDELVGSSCQVVFAVITTVRN